MTKRALEEGCGGKEAVSRGDLLLFRALLFALAALSLWPIWANRLLPMQDYPQHLFLAQITASYHDPGYNWREFYRVDLGFRPYMLWYLAMRLFCAVCQVETAGRVIFSIYILLVTALALAARRLAPKGYLPWGALLLFPLAFNQIYYMGFANYIISLPLVFLALLDLRQLAARPSAVAIVRHAAYLFLLFLDHPYSSLVYIALGATSALAQRKTGRQLLAALAPVCGMAACFAAWYLLQKGDAAPAGVPWSVSWWGLNGTAAYYLLPFTGMRWTERPDWLTAVLWWIIAFLFVAARRRLKGEPLGSSPAASWYFASLAGFFALPFWLGYYSYFNLRLAPVSYFALSLLLSGVALPRKAGWVVALTVAALLFGSVRTQKAVALEAQSILPLLSTLQPNRLVLPLVFDGSSEAVDRKFFYQIHAHESDYYHLLVGGGANPSLFPNAMMPVQYRAGVRLPSPETAERFSWSEHGAYYQYLLVRRGPPALYRDLARNCELVGRSGPWGLFRNGSPPKGR